MSAVLERQRWQSGDGSNGSDDGGDGNGSSESDSHRKRPVRAWRHWGEDVGRFACKQMSVTNSQLLCASIGLTKNVRLCPSYAVILFFIVFVTVADVPNVVVVVVAVVAGTVVVIVLLSMLCYIYIYMYIFNNMCIYILLLFQGLDLYPIVCPNSCS